MYCTAQDIIDRWDDKELARYTDDVNTTNLEINTDVIELCISDAESEINGYLQSIYTIPVTDTVPDLLKVWCIAITNYRIYLRRNPVKIPDSIVKEYESTVKRLTDVNKGLVKLSIALIADNSVMFPNVAAVVRTRSEKVFTEDYFNKMP